MPPRLVVLGHHRSGGGLPRPLVRLLHLLRPLRLHRGLPLLLLQIEGWVNLFPENIYFINKM